MTVYHDSAVRIPGEATQRIGEAAAAANAYVLMGCNELDDRNGKGSIYNSQFPTNRSGDLEYSRRKLEPTYTERVYQGQGDETDKQVAATEFGNIGSLICWEHHMSLLRAAGIQEGGHFHVANRPGSSKGGTSQLLEADRGGDTCDFSPADRQHAFEAGAFTVRVPGILSEADGPDEFGHLLDGARKNIYWACGGSYINNARGEIVSGPSFAEEANPLPRVRSRLTETRNCLVRTRRSLHPS